MSNKDKRYPISLFVTGVLLNLIKNFLLLIPSAILLIIGIWVQWCLFAGLGLLLIDVILSFVEQLRIRNTTLNSDDPNFDEWQDAILSPDWKDNVKNLTESKLDK